MAQSTSANLAEIFVNAAPSKIESHSPQTSKSSLKEQMEQTTQTLDELSLQTIPSPEIPSDLPQSKLPPEIFSDSRAIHRKPLPKPPSSMKL